jgi:hypothetical protein
MYNDGRREDAYVTNRYRPGEKAPESGKYAVLDTSGRKTGEHRFVTKGDPFPPAPSGASYRLIERVETVYTTATSAAVIGSTAETFAEAIERLAKK